MRSNLIIKRAGIGLMATIALSIQPLQYGLLYGVGKALAASGNTGCDPSLYPEDGPNPCLPGPTNPNPTPTTPPPPPAVKYFLLPGIGGDDPGAGNPSGYFNNTKLSTYLQNSLANAASGQTVNTYAPYAQWKTTDLTAQGTALAQTVQARASGNAKVILIGHSMGGLRGREALQFNRGAYPAMNNVVGLVTLGTPHLGAPIIEKGPGAATLIGGTLGLVIGLVPPVNFLTSAAAMFTARALVNGIVNTPSGRDLKPTGNFLGRLNNPASPLPSSVVTVSITGQNNNVDSFAASGLNNTTENIRVSRVNLARGLAVQAGFFFGLAFWTWGLTLPLALALAAASALLFNLPAFWRSNVVGDPKGDSVVPESSQTLPSSAGGGRRIAEVLPKATHTGKFGEYQVNPTGEYDNDDRVRGRIRDLQFETGLPRSPEAAPQ